MRITSDTIAFSKTEVIPWREVRRVRMSGDKLRFVLADGAVKELGDLSPHTIDLAFRTFDAYVRHHKDEKASEEKKGPPKKKQRR